MSSGGGDSHDVPLRDLIGRNVDPVRARFDKRGKNLSVGASEEDLWVPGGRMTWLTSEEKMEVSSTSANDTSAGTGARIVLIYGVDENYDVVSELVTLNGTTAVTTTANFFRINSAQFVSAGSTGYNEGDISINGASTGALQGFIETEIGVMHMLNFAVPNGHHVILTDISQAAETAQDVELYTYVRAPGAGLPYWACYTDEVLPGGKLSTNRQVYSVFPEKTDINVRVKKISGTSGACFMAYVGYVYKGENVSASRPFNIGL